MKKAVEFLKQNRNALIVLVLLIALIIIAISLSGSSLSASSTGGSDLNKSQTEIKLQQILSEIEGVGKAEVMINEGAEGIEGVIIVCSGANNLMTRNNIISAVSTLLKVNGNKIAIYAMTN